MVNKNIKWGENVIELNEFIKIINECENRLPLLTLDEFFSENKVEDSIAPHSDLLSSGGAEEINIFDLDNLFSCRPIVPEGFRCFEIVWD